MTRIGLIIALLLSAVPAAAQEFEAAPANIQFIETEFVTAAPRTRLWRMVDEAQVTTGAALVAMTAADARTTPRDGTSSFDRASWVALVGGASLLFWQKTGELSRDRWETLENGDRFFERGKPKTAMIVRAALIAFNAWGTYVSFEKVQRRR